MNWYKHICSTLSRGYVLHVASKGDLIRTFLLYYLIERNEDGPILKITFDIKAFESSERKKLNGESMVISKKKKKNEKKERDVLTGQN